MDLSERAGGLRRKGCEKRKGKVKKRDNKKAAPVDLSERACGARNVKRGRGREERGSKIATPVDLSEHADD